MHTAKHRRAWRIAHGTQRMRPAKRHHTFLFHERVTCAALAPSVRCERQAAHRCAVALITHHGRESPVRWRRRQGISNEPTYSPFVALCLRLPCAACAKQAAGLGLRVWPAHAAACKPEGCQCAAKGAAHRGRLMHASTLVRSHKPCGNHRMHMPA